MRVERWTEARWTLAAWLAAGLLGASGVALAAAAAHLGPSVLDPVARDRLEHAVQMQMWHALALLGAGVVAASGGLLARLAVAGFVLGTLLFSGGLTAAAFGWHAAVAVAPAGGTILILAWLALAGAAARRLLGRDDG